jgi:hypothetical protein
VFLVPAYAVVVAAPSGPDQGCPSPHQIADALNARIPALIVSGSEATNPGTLKLTVSGGTGATPLRIEMVDQGGEARLFRNLTVAEPRRNDCVALAETVALIVDRFVHDLGYEAPPTLPAPLPAPDANLTRGPPPAGASRFDVFAGGSWRGASSEESDFEAGFGLGFERGLAGRRFAVTFTGGMSAARHVTTPDAYNGMLRRMPFRLGFWIPILAGPGQVEPGIRIGVDLLSTSLSSTGSTNQASSQAPPRGELALCYRATVLRRVFARIGAAVGAGNGYHWTSNGAPLFVESRYYFRSGLELGFSFQ